MGITMDVYFKYWVQCGIVFKKKNKAVQFLNSLLSYMTIIYCKYLC